MGTKLKWLNNRGMTLIELLVGISLGVMILLPLYNFLITGNRMEFGASSQADLQDTGEQVLLQILEGKEISGVRVGGMRQASKISVTPGVGMAFIVPQDSSYYQITYYYQSGFLFYKTSTATADQNPAVDAAGGTNILENVGAFAVTEQTGANLNKYYTITLQMEDDLGNGGGNAVTLSAIVAPRNM